MTFLKQGKTNWKYILIVLILALIVGGGILGYLRYFKREMISLTKFPEIKKPEKVVEEKPEVKDGLEEKTVSEKASIPLDIINSDEELSKYLIEKLSLDKNTKFTFIRGKLDKDSDKETIPFFSYTSPTTAMAYRGIIQENLEGFFITVFEDDPCYCFKVNVYTKKMVSDQPEFIISNYLPLTGTCVAFDVVSILTIGEGISFENEFKNIWQGFTYECTILHQSTIADIEFKDLDGDNNLEIIQKGYVIDCGDECCCKEGIKKEEFQKIFKWNEETQSFEEMITDFMDARMGKFGEESLIRAKSHLTDNGKKSYSQIEFIDFALVGISNPHYSRYEILKSEKLNSNKFEFTVRIYEYLVETKEKGDFDYFDEELIVIKIDNNYLVDSVERGETVMIQGETANWKTYRNEEYGFEIKYPEKLNTEFISLHSKSVPPKMVVSSNISQLVCEEFERKSTVEFPTASQKKITVEGETYCRFSGAEGTAGTTYVTYRYSTIKNEKQITLEFTLLYPDCGNYYGIDNKMEKCRREEDVFDPDILAHQMLSTFRFLE